MEMFNNHDFKTNYIMHFSLILILFVFFIILIGTLIINNDPMNKITNPGFLDERDPNFNKIIELDNSGAFPEIGSTGYTNLNYPITRLDNYNSYILELKEKNFYLIISLLILLVIFLGILLAFIINQRVSKFLFKIDSKENYFAFDQNLKENFDKENIKYNKGFLENSLSRIIQDYNTKNEKFFNHIIKEDLQLSTEVNSTSENFAIIINRMLASLNHILKGENENKNSYEASSSFKDTSKHSQELNQRPQFYINSINQEVKGPIKEELEFINFNFKTFFPVLKKVKRKKILQNEISSKNLIEKIKKIIIKFQEQNKKYRYLKENQFSMRS